MLDRDCALFLVILTRQNEEEAFQVACYLCSDISLPNQKTHLCRTYLVLHVRVLKEVQRNQTLRSVGEQKAGRRFLLEQQKTALPKIFCSGALPPGIEHNSLFSSEQNVGAIKSLFLFSNSRRNVLRQDSLSPYIVFFGEKLSKIVRISSESDGFVPIFEQL